MTLTRPDDQQTPEESGGRQGHAAGLGRRVRQYGGGAVGSIALTLTVVIVVGMLWVGEQYLSASNLMIIGSFLTVPLIVGMFASFCLLAGVVDLSIGSMVAFSAATFAAFVGSGWPAWPSALLTLVLCSAFGVINAVAIVVFNADAIASTLGMLTVLRGVTRVMLEDHSSVPAFIPEFHELTRTPLGPVPLIFVLALVAAAVATVIVLLTRLGRRVRAVGGDPVAAGRAGINGSRIRFVALICCAVGAGIGGIVYVGQLGAASVVLGDGLEFEVYAALLIGGYSIMRGGVGNPAGGVMGLLVVAGVNNMLDLQRISSYWVHIVVGLLLVGAVLLDRIRGGDEYE